MSIVSNIKKKIILASRNKKLDQFYANCHEGMTVLDVGFANETKKKVAETTNYFLKNYRYDRKTYTGLGVDGTDGMNELYPECRFVNYDGGTFPFEDNEFDWVFSNAVIEHVGDDARQLKFLNEMMRVAKNVYFTTPNKYFPIESHTNVLFLHWYDDLFYKYCAKHKPFYANREHLYLFSKSRLKNMLDESIAKKYTITSNKVASINMTFSVECEK